MKCLGTHRRTRRQTFCFLCLCKLQALSISTGWRSHWGVPQLLHLLHSSVFIHKKVLCAGYGAYPYHNTGAEHKAAHWLIRTEVHCRACCLLAKLQSSCLAQAASKGKTLDLNTEQQEAEFQQGGRNRRGKDREEAGQKKTRVQEYLMQKEKLYSALAWRVMRLGIDGQDSRVWMRRLRNRKLTCVARNESTIWRPGQEGDKMKKWGHEGTSGEKNLCWLLCTFL